MLDEISEEIAGIYAKRTGATPEEMRAAMKAETWMGAKEAVERKFADSILKFDTGAKAMSILAKLFPGNVEAEKLEAEIAENSNLRTELATAQAKITELQNLAAIVAEKDSEIAAKVSEISELKNQVQAAADSITAKDVEITKLNEAATATAEKISIEAARHLAATGHPTPIGNAPEGEASANKMTLLAFNSLTPAARMKFIKSGGKISN
jgi:chromosome segregation ATPase